MSFKHMLSLVLVMSSVLKFDQGVMAVPVDGDIAPRSVEHNLLSMLDNPNIFARDAYGKTPTYPEKKPKAEKPKPKKASHPDKPKDKKTEA
ncbi:hypothetical protein DFH28DRAFT_945554 [Melampsora americana]|nr:hypothetical protein DFH28DRAFT_945554 [Melampsora americana]